MEFKLSKPDETVWSLEHWDELITSLEFADYACDKIQEIGGYCNQV